MIALAKFFSYISHADTSRTGFGEIHWVQGKPWELRSGRALSTRANSFAHVLVFSYTDSVDS